MLILYLLAGALLGWCVLWMVAVYLGLSSTETEEFFITPEPRKPQHRDRGFSDAEITDQSFPDPRMNVKDHRKARHAYYREQVAEVKRRKAVVLYRNGWVGVLWDIWHGKDNSVEVQDVE